MDQRYSQILAAVQAAPLQQAVILRFCNPARVAYEANSIGGWDQVAPLQAGEAVGGVAVALRRGPLVPPGRLLKIGADAFALFVKHPQVELRLRQPLIRRCAPPAGRLGRVAVHPLALHVVEAEVRLRPGLPLPGRAPGTAERLGGTATHPFPGVTALADAGPAPHSAYGRSQERDRSGRVR